MTDRKLSTPSIIVLCITLYVIINIWNWSSNHSSSPSSQAAADPPENVIHLTTNWSEAIEPGYDRRLIAHMCTPNLYWETKLKFVGGEEKVYTLAPINYSESTKLKIDQAIVSQRWRIRPADAEPLNKGKALFGELRWHREPAGN